MYKNLSHLSQEEIDVLMQRYYDGESITTLLKEYSLNVHASDLFRLFPPEVHADYICDYCGSALVIDRKSKSNKNASRHQYELYCPFCGHKPFVSQCNCSNCVQVAIDLNNERIKQIKEFYSNSGEPVDFDTLSFESKVYLGAICRAFLRENMFEIAPRTEKNNILAPSDMLYKEIYDTLILAGVLTVSPNSSIDAFVVDSDNFPSTYYTYKVIYNLNLLFPANKQDLFSKILDPNYYTSDNAMEAVDLWRKISIAECIEYLQYQLEKVNFEFSPGDKTYKTFEILLNDYSVSQIYGVIWKSVADASKLYLEKGMSRIHAANAVIGACERYAERAKINHWELTSYRRVRDLPQSALSLFYFNRVLGIGDMGFEVPPTIV